MKPENRFPESLTEAFKPKFNAPQEDVTAACDRVFHRLESADVETLPDTENRMDRLKVSTPWFRPVLALSGAAVMVLIVLLTSADSRAFVESADGGIFLVSNGHALRDGDRIEAGAAVRANGGAGTALKLPDGSRLEMRSKSELSWERANDGLRIQLKRGSVIVNAAKQRTRHLYVQTKDVTVSVVGTVFLVNAEEEGSSVSVIEGEVRVQQGNLETKLRPGEHVSTAAIPEPRPMKEEIAWSPKAEEHLALLQQSRPSTPSEAPRQRFEEAAIRECSPQQQRVPDNLPAGARGGGELRFIELSPGRFYARCMTVGGLIMASHPRLLTPTDPPDIPASQLGAPPLVFGKTYYYGMVDQRGKFETLRGAPEWVYSDGYTIEAITDASTDALAMMKVMLPELLERRFQVKTHTEVEQVPALQLTITPGGLKIKPFQEGDCDREKKTNFPNPKPRCGQVYGNFNGPNYRVELGNNPLRTLGLASAFAVPVIDRTGNADRFALIFEFGPDESSPGALRMCQAEILDKGPDHPCATRPTAPSIHTVLNQLGLKVEPTKGPREFIVVDRAERPSAN